MGLKSGSRDAGFEEEETDNSEAESADTASRKAEDQSTPLEGDRGTDTDAEPTTQTGSGSADTGARKTGSEGHPAASSIPYKLRRERVNEGREQVPYFLREEVIEAEGDLQNALEEMLGEDVYKSDYREAAMVVAQRNPELVAEVLREWGYDLDGI